MLSILIPVYNCPVRNLVDSVRKQAGDAEIDYEFVIIDDGSDERFCRMNRDLSSLPGVIYTELGRNVGRAAVRNMLAAAARYPYLLFIDGDARVTDGLFIKKYLSYCTGEVVVCGGTAYEPDPPADRQLLLRWKYGRLREQREADRRNRRPHEAFSAFNFMASSSVMRRLRFNEELTRYGHEDTLFGYSLFKEKIPVCHIDNPLLHAGLEPSPVFLEKTRAAVANLAGIYGQYRLDRDFLQGISLIRLYKHLRKWNMHRFIFPVLSAFEKTVERNLKGKRPCIPLLQLYKLMWFHAEISRH